MRLIIAGFGNVGKAFSKLVTDQTERLKAEYGLVPRIVAVVNSKGAAVSREGISASELAAFQATPMTSNNNAPYHVNGAVLDILREVEADVLLEFTPSNLKTGQPGLGHIEAAMSKGLSVVTTNKGPLALAMPALVELARYKGVEFRFSGTVGGGTPVLQLAKECLEGNRILAVEGILNGTTNYILTRMHEAGISLQDALDEAKRLGYAEADPSMDIGGFDTAAKLVILSNWTNGGKLTIRDVAIQGISELTPNNIEAAKRSGGAVKLIGSASDGEASVSPRTVSSKSPLYVSGALNAVAFKTENAGIITLVGHGSGGTETAAAALRDLVSIKRTILDGNAR